MKNTKLIGNIGEAKALSKFVELEIPVLLPFGDNERYDMVIDLKGKFYRIQVKTTEKITSGCIKFSAYQSYKSYTRYYTNDEIDYFILYCIPLDKLYMMAIKDITANDILLRIEPVKNNQKKLIKYAIDYELDIIIKNMEV